MAQSANLLVVCNSASREMVKYLHYLKPYLEHFRFPFEELDLAHDHDLGRLSSCSCLLLSHPDLSLRDVGFEKRLAEAVRQAFAAGVGAVFFDTGLYHTLTGHEGWSFKGTVQTRHLTFQPHFITTGHGPEEKIKLFGKMHVIPLSFPDGKTLVLSDGLALLAVRRIGEAGLAVWTSMDWVSTFILGPLGGLDDCFWRSIVWAAKKPFAMASLPPVVTMRVDDVAGTGTGWKRSPLYWAQSAVKAGFRLWLGLFIYNLSPEAVAELRGMVTSGNVTAFPHAFGRPPRDGGSDLYYNPQGLPRRSETDDEFIYFNHHHRAPWSDEEARRGIEAVDRWYAENEPLPMSRYAFCHRYEAGNNTIRHMADAWGVKFLATVKDPESAFADETNWLKAGPYRLYEQPGTCGFNPARRGERPVYYADFVTFSERRFFNCMTEIREAGFEWNPDNDIAETVGRGIRQLHRALNSRALATLGASESDFIGRIEPQKWEEEIKGIAAALAAYKPVFMTIEDAALTVMAHRTSRFVSSRPDASGRLMLEFSGVAPAATSVSVFEDRGGTIVERRMQVPVFKGSFKALV